ncbi:MULTISPECIES: tetratricopeptide repeat-containing sensor histidine kinase [unclassified Polaribacter]|uniref:ATP-binding protein n=1 Tax=unclassified Polaribacter TaxID=196858 RepID=UPI0011BFA98D|nr:MULTISPECIES: tetratricopeptide repeat-containing sensor histidine kinase [unclassified Polaribacter]TXD53877.1 tetratricopeptide repeat protein [Polaribacter sp. IC063]TXD58553.1 tetratricopeptide repeat protein [Polaribacter sp. IC066]
MKNIISIFFFICLGLYQVNAIENNLSTEEVFSLKTSSVFSVKNDSLIELRYNEIFEIYSKEKYVEALKQSLALLDKAKNIKNYYWIYKCNSLIADIYDRTNKFDESLKYYKQSFNQLNRSLVEGQNTSFKDIDLASTLLRIGGTYHRLSVSQEEKNKTYYLDSAKIYYEKLERLPTLNADIESLIAKAYTNLSAIYEKDSMYVKAEWYVRKSIIIHEKHNNNVSTAVALNNLGNIFLSQKEYKKSKELYLDAIELIKNNEDSKAIRIKSSLYFNLAWAMRNLKDYKAYDIQELSYEIEGDIREEEFSGIIEQVKQKYDFDAQKEQFQEQEEVKWLRDQRIFWSIGILAVLIIVTLVYWLTLYKLKQNNLALQLNQVELIQNQNLDKLKSETQVRILNATIDGKESERKEIAETLHDSVSALLSSANLHLQATRKQFNGNTPIEIDKTQQIIQEASHKIRDLSHTLVSSVLLKFGLTFAIKDIAEKYSNSQLNIETDIINIRRYQQNFEIKLYNITQEFINNILKHSKADNALIELREENNRLFLTISDDGIGFDKTKINTKSGGLGINQIDARIQMMKGEFQIKSSLNNGTTILVELPVIEKEDPNLVSLTL